MMTAHNEALSSKTAKVDFKPLDEPRKYRLSYELFSRFESGVLKCIKSEINFSNFVSHMGRSTRFISPL